MNHGHNFVHTNFIIYFTLLYYYKGNNVKRNYYFLHPSCLLTDPFINHYEPTLIHFQNHFTMQTLKYQLFLEIEVSI